MGALSTIAGLIRQSSIDEMNKKRLEQDMADRNRRYQDDMSAREREIKVGQGLADIYRLKENASDLRIRASLSEQEGQRRFASQDPESGKYFGAASGLMEQALVLEKLSKQRARDIQLEVAKDSPKMRETLLSQFFSEDGIDPSKAVKEAMVKVKVKKAGEKIGDEQEYSYEVPASQASAVLGGAPSPVAGRQNDDRTFMNTMNMFQAYSGTGVSPYSTGEQPIDSATLFSQGGGQAQQPQAQPSSNPFAPTQSAKALPPEGSVIVQNGKRYRITNGVPTQIP